MTRVILTSIDGFAGFYWSDPRLRVPTLRRLAERGVRRTAADPRRRRPPPPRAGEDLQVLGDDLVEHGVLGVSGPVDRWLEGHGPQVGSRRRPGQC